MKVFIACLGTETNTFSPIPTGEENFAETMLFHGDATKREPLAFSAPLHAWRRLTEERQGQVAESIAAFAQPAGRTLKRVYESYRGELLDDLKKALPVDIVLLNMHGAMVAEGYDDCEGDLLSKVRAIVGPKTIIGGELDLHCHITQTMIDAADVLITFKEYPHTDTVERAEELFRICEDAAAGRVKPVMSVHDMRMINMWRTRIEPVKGFVAKMQSLEGKDDVLSVSFGHGFAWGDVADVGAKMLVVTDDNAEKGMALAKDLAKDVWQMRDATPIPAMSTDEALDKALAVAGGPVVLTDMADNAGGGAPADSTYVLKRILERGIPNVASGLYWDPVSVRFCVEAGVGASFDLRIGGKVGTASGLPVDLPITVRAIRHDMVQTFGPSKNPMGTAVWVSSANDLDLVLMSIRTQTFHPDAFEQLGLDLSKKKLVIVKSSNHFYAGFQPIAKEIFWIMSEGAIAPTFAAIPYTKLAKPYWPKVEDPFAA